MVMYAATRVIFEVVLQPCCVLTLAPSLFQSVFSIASPEMPICTPAKRW